MAQNRKKQRSSHDSSLQSDSQAPRGSGRQPAQGQKQSEQRAANLQDQILGAVTPAFQEVRSYIEGSPVRAAAIGAVAGGLLMTLFSTEKGRAFVRVAYDYANPMVAKYAREYISKAAGDMAESAVAH